MFPIASVGVASSLLIVPVALSGVPAGRLSVADFGRVSADNEAFAGWVAKTKDRFRTRPAPAGAGQKAQATPAAKPAPARQAQAAPPATAPAKG